jgi:hypothetical protein
VRESHSHRRRGGDYCQEPAPHVNAGSRTIHSMNSVGFLPVCATCGDRVGVYEPIWLERADGTLVRSGLLEIGDEPIACRVFHSGCRPVAPVASPIPASP